MRFNTQETKRQPSDSPYFDQARLETLTEIISYRFDELFEALDVNLNKTAKMYIGCCPIHGGDNASAMNLYRDGYAVKGFWKCRTHHCEQVFKKTIIGFIRGVLSHHKKGWTRAEDSDKMISFKEAIDWACKFVGQDIRNLKVNNEEISNKKFVAQMMSLVKEKTQTKGINRKQVRDSLEIPAKFFLDKGYQKQILDSYDIGLCKTSGKEMFNRVVTPIYDDNKNIMVACTGRTVHPECNKCKLYHNLNNSCPTEDFKELKYSKWRNSSGSNVSSYLYNYWSAKKFIKETGTVILVEGPADVWKLEELGIHNSLALFGLELSDEQQVLIEMSGAFNVVILLDMDEPGRKAIGEIKRKLERSYRIYVPEISVNDPGDYDSTIVDGELRPILKAINR